MRDGADDQDHDDIPNLNELSRIDASGLDDRKNQDCKPKDSLGEGNFSVSGGPLPDGAVVVTFQNELGEHERRPDDRVRRGSPAAPPPRSRVTTTRGRRPGVDEQQSVTITGSPTAGSFTLTFDGKTTSQLAFNSDPATVAAALKELVPANDSNHPTAYGRVNPFNPCLPATFSRTCPRHINAGHGRPVRRLRRTGTPCSKSAPKTLLRPWPALTSGPWSLRGAASAADRKAWSRPSVASRPWALLALAGMALLVWLGLRRLRLLRL